MEVNNVREELKKEFKKVPLNSKDRLAFLHGMNVYLSYVQSTPILRKIITSIQEESVRKTIEIAQASLESNYAKDHYDIMSEAEDVDIEERSKQFPTYEYNELLRGNIEFEKVKHLKTLEDISEAEISIEEKSSLGAISRTVPGHALIRLSKYGYPTYIQHLQVSLLRELDKVEEKGILSKYLHYDAVYGILYFKGKEIKINLKKRITNSHYLLAYLLVNNPFEKHYYDELEDEEVLLERKSWTSYYDACEDIQAKVMNVTGIEDFLDYNSGNKMYVRINSKYSLHKIQH